MQWAKQTKGFTIVELLIVIVVIGILAAITIVAFNGIQNRARVALIQSDLEGSTKKLESYKVTSSSEKYPVDLTSANLTASKDNAFQYFYNATSNIYCLSETNGDNAFYVTTLDKKIRKGACTSLDGLIGWWTFNGNANDLSGYGNAGQNNGATDSVGQQGDADAAYTMDSATIQIPGLSDYPNLTSGGFTYSLWTMRTAASPGHWPIIMGSTNTHSYYGIRSQNYGNNIGVEYGKSPYDSTSFTNMGNSVTDLNTWHLYTFTYDGATINYYVDGALKGSSITPLNPSNGNVVFNSWTGSDDDARIYNRALSATEVSALYAANAL